MANGVPCKRCGYQESAHIGGLCQGEYGGDYKAMAKDHPKLVKCKGYVPKTKEGYLEEKGGWEPEDYD